MIARITQAEVTKVLSTLEHLLDHYGILEAYLGTIAMSIIAGMLTEAAEGSILYLLCLTTKR